MIADFFIGTGINAHCGYLPIIIVTHVSAKINTVQPCVVSLQYEKMPIFKTEF